MKLLFVCTGNICRSPTAEAVFRKRAEAAGLTGLVVDSAATHDHHIGEAPDPRAVEHAKKRGYDLANLRARQVSRADFEEFDYIYALDNKHLEKLKRLMPVGSKAKLALMYSGGDVPDPYYGGANEFEEVLDIVEKASDEIIAELKNPTPNKPSLRSL